MDLPLVIEPLQAPTENVVFILHGLGANKYDFQPVAEYLAKKLPHTKFILPQAPTKAISLNNGYKMPAWFDLSSLEDIKQINFKDLDESADTLIAAINEQEKQGIATKNIVLAGFSQGGAVVYHTAFKRYHGELGGVLAMSSFGPSIDEDIQIDAVRKQTPTLVIHGTHDNVIALAIGQKTYTQLKGSGANVIWADYPMQHQVLPEEIYYIEQWLANCLPHKEKE